MALQLEERDERMLSGAEGEAGRTAMEIVVAMAEVAGAERLVDIASAHIDGCLYHGQVSLDFAERLAAGGASVRVPTTLNVGSVDLLHPELYRGNPDTAQAARRLMDLYAEMGCRTTWTCAPYQMDARPAFGEHVAWAESNAIVFANSVLGARTDRYGDFIDICAAVTGRAPYAGLHVTENRRGEILFRLAGIPERLLDEDVFYPVLGHLVGMEAGTLVPAIDGVPADVSEDRLKALGAAAASSGSVGLFHAVGVTPEASTLDEALQGREPVRTIDVTPEAAARARDSLTTAADGKLRAVSVGTPHFSLSEFGRLVALLDGVRVSEGVEFYVSTGRSVLTEAESRGWVDLCEGAGITIVTDTCTYVTPILRAQNGVVMTNSGKWAYYAPGNLGVQVVFGSLAECVRSAVEGKVWRDPDVWARV
ncbi:MAG TPA: aconitase X catalytic domain-containing protein [Actinomycetota bacterium]|jgi:predicted aconitase|nr:aconitase X catalytic domain-containing protein [Actinomycetota bacterium]